jgi:hypothetical protein
MPQTYKLLYTSTVFSTVMCSPTSAHMDFSPSIWPVGVFSFPTFRCTTWTTSADAGAVDDILGADGQRIDVQSCHLHGGGVDDHAHMLSWRIMTSSTEMVLYSLAGRTPPQL